MSTTANWSYTNTATVRPFLHFDLSTQEAVYGPEYEIACTWVAKGEQVRDNNGAEFVSRHQISVSYTHLPSPRD
ncbi:hypothetical protein FA119_18715, partial [Pseudomonas aeruginosa]|nr:hypothetical protein [Pseudomonas aeruginosa]